MSKSTGGRPRGSSNRAKVSSGSLRRLVLLCCAVLFAAALTMAMADRADADIHYDTVTSTPTAIFEDVPPSYWAFDYINALYNSGDIVGCSITPRLYCPDNVLTRAEGAVFVLHGAYGPILGPPYPPPSTPTFGDVPSSYWGFGWIESLWIDGYTAGCSSIPLLFCPERETTRAESSVFFLRIKNGASFVPPSASGIFADAPLNTWYTPYVEAAYNQGLLPACNTDPLMICPEDPLDRAMAAYMMVQARGGLPLPTVTPTATQLPGPTATPTVTPSFPPTSTSTPTPIPSPTATSIPTSTPTSPPPPAHSIVVDHNSVALFDSIPESYLQAAASLRMLFMDRSVGMNINEGLTCLSYASSDLAPNNCVRYQHVDPRYSVDPSEVTWSHPGGYDRSNWDFATWTTPGCDNWYDKVGCFLSYAGSRINSYDVVSYQLSYLSVDDSSSIVDVPGGFFYDNPDRYDVFDQQAFQAQHPGKVNIYWTSSLSRGIGTNVAESFNEQMRQYAISNNLPLFDVADIESHDPDGNPCYDNRDGVAYDNGNHSENHPNDGLNLPAICQQYTTEVDGGHLGSVSAGKIRIAKAFWVLMAQIAGWDGTP